MLPAARSLGVLQKMRIDHCVATKLYIDARYRTALPSCSTEHLHHIDETLGLYSQDQDDVADVDAETKSGCGYDEAVIAIPGIEMCRLVVRRQVAVEVRNGERMTEVPTLLCGRDVHG